MGDGLEVAVRILLVGAGAALAAWTVLSAVRTVVLPRAEQVALTSFVFVTMRVLFNGFARRIASYEGRDHVMAFYAPVSLMCLPAVWLFLTLTAYTAIFGGVLWFRHDAVHQAFAMSGSSLLTLGFARPATIPGELLAFTEAALGVGLLALLITFLPSMYAAFSRREAAVTVLEVRAGSPPTGVNMIERYYRIRGLDDLEEQWSTWEAWFADIEESHTSFAALVFFRSPAHHRSWVTAAGAVLDAASLFSSSVAVERAPLANLCIRSGYLALRSVASFFAIPFDPNPRYNDPISIEKEEFFDAYERLAALGVPMRPDREQAWHDFKGWRVNYDAVLLQLAALTMAPLAPWSSDRSGPYQRPRVLRRGRRARAVV